MLPTWVSDELLTLLGRLTPRQRQAVVRIVEAELAGVPLRALLEGPNRICTKTTYYRTSPRPGWHHQARFREALAMARRDAAGHRLATALEEAIEELTLAAPEAARELRRQVRGDLAAVQALASALGRAEDPGERLAVIRALALTDLPAALPILTAILEVEEDEEARSLILGGIVRIAAGLNADRRKAAESILDRADMSTASKGSSELVFESYEDRIRRLRRERGLEDESG